LSTIILFSSYILYFDKISSDNFSTKSSFKSTFLEKLAKVASSINLLLKNHQEYYFPPHQRLLSVHL